METTKTARDKFSSSEYDDKQQRAPRIIPVRGEYDENHYGFFITSTEASLAGWVDYDPTNLITYRFSSKNQETGFLIQEPRFLVCPKTPLMGLDKSASREAQRPIILGPWQPEFKADGNIQNCQYYSLFLLGDDNQLLHSIPFQFAAKGATGATFSISWQQFIGDMVACHASANKIPNRPKDARFKSLCVFEPILTVRLAGTKEKSNTLVADSYEKPTIANWQQSFVGCTNLEPFVLESLEPLIPTPMLQLQSAQ